MRIISGSLKGRKFRVPGHFPVRPTTDFAREALFNILNNRIDLEDERVLDLFTGTGSIALECWSRGCRSILAIDQHAGCIKYLDKLCKELDLQGLQTLKSEVESFLKRPDHYSYDLIFADPPYAFGRYEEVLKLILDNNWLEEDGLLILEHDKHTDLTNLPGFVEEKKYGNVRFSFFERTS